MKLLKWIGWRLYYAVRPSPKGFDAIMLKSLRTMPRKFTPYMYRNDDGRCWEIFFSGEGYYMKRQQLTCDVAIGRDTGEVVGLTVFDAK